MTTFFLSPKIFSIDRISFVCFDVQRGKEVLIIIYLFSWMTEFTSWIITTMVKPMKSKSSKSSTAPSIVGMASDVDDDQVLPDSLRKLEIVSVYSNSLAACKANNERHQNPFLTELSTENCSANDRVRPYCIRIKKTKTKKIAHYFVYFHASVNGF